MLPGPKVRKSEKVIIVAMACSLSILPALAESQQVLPAEQTAAESATKNLTIASNSWIEEATTFRRASGVKRDEASAIRTADASGIKSSGNELEVGSQRKAGGTKDSSGIQSSGAAIDPQDDLKQIAVTMSGKTHQEDLLSGLEGGNWKRQFEAAQAEYNKRGYEEAEKRLLEVLKTIKQGMAKEQRLVAARNLLADVYLGTDKLEDAHKLYAWCASAAKRDSGGESVAEAHALYGLSRVLLLQGKPAEAQEPCKQALQIQAKILGQNSHAYGMSLVTMGRILAAQGWPEQADKFFERGIGVLKQGAPEHELDFADALRDAALFKQQQGQQADAQVLFEKSYSLKDNAVAFDQSPHIKGTVRFQWEEGSPRSLEIPDRIVPLKYMCSKNIRVACTVIDLWELFGILVSVTNVGDHKKDLGLGKVALLRTNGNISDPKAEKLELVAHDHIDVKRREMDIWRLTYNRPWLANMQKTRNVRGLVPAHGHDLFRGPNVFGIYGEWNATNRVLPEKFALEPSPEQVEEQAEAIVDPSLVRSRNLNAPGLIPVSLEPFESRTGEQFYMNPRCENVLLRIWVGNTSFEFPFKMPKKRTAI